MFDQIFDFDNKVWRFIGKFFDIIILNLLWIICSIPIITIGAATTAVYYVTLKLARDEEGSIVKGFFTSFKENFKQSTIIWIIMLVVGIPLGMDLYFFVLMRETFTQFQIWLTALVIVFVFIYLCVLIYVFPLQAKFYNPIRKTIGNCFWMLVRYFPYTVLLVMIDLSIIVLPLFVFSALRPFLFLFGFPLMAFANSYILVKIFDRTISENA